MCSVDERDDALGTVPRGLNRLGNELGTVGRADEGGHSVVV
jgi:hypothetical protein